MLLKRTGVRAFFYGVSVLIGGAFFSLGSSVQAACLLNGVTSTNTGTSGPDSLLCDSLNPTTTADSISGQEGGDEISVLEDSGALEILGNQGQDTILFNTTGEVVNDISGGEDGDTITIEGIPDGGIIYGSVRGDTGKDEIYILSGTIEQNVLGNEDDDLIQQEGGLISGVINGGEGQDEINLYGGASYGVFGGDEPGNQEFVGDEINLGYSDYDINNEPIAVGNAIVYGDISGGEGWDNINLVSGQVFGSVFGDGGSDNIALGSDTVRFDMGVPSFIGTVEVLGNLDGGSGDDFFILYSGLVDGSVLGGEGDDSIVLGAYISDFVNNTFILLGNAKILGDIDGGGGDDAISLHSGSVEGNVQGGDGNDFISLGEVIENINGNLTAFGVASITGDLSGGAGDDQFDLVSGHVGGSVQGDDGDDLLDLGIIETDNNGNKLLFGSADISGDIDMGAGDDDSDFLSGTLHGNALSGSGNDSVQLGKIRFDANDEPILLGQADLLGGIDLGDGNDEASLVSGTVHKDVLGGSGKDTIHLGEIVLDNNDVPILLNNGDPLILGQAHILGNLDGGVGNDTVLLLSGTVDGSVFGGGDDDVISLGESTSSGGAVGTAKIGGSLDGGVGNDTISLLAGQVSTSVLGQNGSDTIVIGRDFVVGDLLLDGGDDLSVGDGFIDTLVVDGGTHPLQGDKTLNFERVVIQKGAIVRFSDGHVAVGTNTQDSNGGLSVVNGTLLADNDLNVTGGVNVGPQGIITAGSTNTNSQNDFSVSGNLNNSGLIDMTTGTQGVQDTLHVGGNYTGNGGVLRSDVNIFQETADVLYVTGDVLGTTNLQLHFEQPTGQLLSSDILLVESSGNSSGTFASQSVLLGLFRYDVVKIEGTPNTPASDKWVLRSTFDPKEANVIVGPIVPTVNRIVSDFQNYFPDQDIPQGRCLLNPWVRGKVGQASFDTGAKSSAGQSFSTSSDVDYSAIEAGDDCGFMVGDFFLHLGVLGGAVSGDGTSAQEQNIKFSFEAPFVGAYATASSGSFFLGLVYTHDFYTLSFFDPRLSLGTLRTHGNGDRLRGQVNYTFDLGGSFFLRPTASLEYAALSFGAFDFGAGQIDLGDVTSVVSRLGARLFREYTSDTMHMKIRPFAEAFFVHDFDGQQRLSFIQPVQGNSFLTTHGAETYATLGAGVEFEGMTSGMVGFFRVDSNLGDRINTYSLEGGMRFNLDFLGRL